MTGSDAGDSRIEARIDIECVLRSRTSVYRFAFGRVRTSAIVAGVCATTQNDAQRGPAVSIKADRAGVGMVAEAQLPGGA